MNLSDFRSIVDRHTVSIRSPQPLDGEWVPVPSSADLVAICRMPQESSVQIAHWQEFLAGRDPVNIARSELRVEVFRGLNYQGDTSN